MCRSWEQNLSSHRYSSQHHNQQEQEQYHHQQQQHHQQPRHLNRHVSDVSSDRVRYSYESASSNYRARMENKRTDYPVAPRKLTRESKSDIQVGLHPAMAEHHPPHSTLPRDFGGGSQGSQGSHGSGVVYRQRPSSSSSIDRSSYSAGDSRSSYNGSFRDPVPPKKMVDTSLYFPGSLRGTAGTPNSSQSDDSHMDRINLR